MRHRRRHRTPVERRRFARKEKKRQEKWDRVNRREAYAKKRDAEFFEAYKLLCAKYKRFFGGLTAETSINTRKTSREVLQELNKIDELYSYNCYRSQGEY